MSQRLTIDETKVLRVIQSLDRLKSIGFISGDGPTVTETGGRHLDTTTIQMSRHDVALVLGTLFPDGFEPDLTKLVHAEIEGKIAAIQEPKSE